MHDRDTKQVKWPTAANSSSWWRLTPRRVADSDLKFEARQRSLTLTAMTLTAAFHCYVVVRKPAHGRVAVGEGVYGCSRISCLHIVVLLLSTNKRCWDQACAP